VDPADAVFRRGRVLTMDPARPVADGLAMADGRIVAVGANDALEAWVGRSTRVIDLDGRTVVPGFIDPHTHIAGNAQDPRNVECRDFFDHSVDSLEVVLSRLAAARATLPPGEWVVGVASPLQGTRMREGRLPTRAELDAAVPDRPAYLTIGPHLMLANSAALRACGVTAQTPDPAGGVIERDETGEPTGWLREVAQRPFKEGRPNAQQDLAARLLRELERCARRGVTMVHEIVKSPAEIRAYQELARAGRLPLRVRLVPRVFQAEFDYRAISSLGLLPGFGNEMLSLGGVKISVDGGSSAGQAAFYHTGSDGDATRSVLRMTEDEVDEIVSAYHTAGMQLFVHAVGDLALDIALRSFERALGAAPRRDHRHRIEHMGNYGLTAERIAKAKALGLVAVPNPSSLHYLGARTIERYGAARLGRQYPFRWLAEQGLPFAFASDGGGLWPVDPLRDIGTAVSRRDSDSNVLDDGQAVPVIEAIRAFTAGAAWAGFGEDRYGTLAPGMRADIAVLSGDPLAVEPADLGRIEVEAALLDGRLTHASGGLAPIHDLAGSQS
jgi:predicted amidohydrolase YtcJ